MARPVGQVLEVLDLLHAGMPQKEVARRTGVPLNTIRLWRKGRLPLAARLRLAGVELCPTCGGPAHDFNSLPAEAYTYLLGLYLGDGCLWRVGRHGCYLKLALDAKYPWIIISARDAIQDVRGGRLPPVSAGPHGHYVTISSHWRGWPCLFPQHGPGRKHEREIELTAWQSRLVERHPHEFLRGLIHTDGWRGVNKVTSKGRSYEYPRYQFSNRSPQIRKLFTDTCELIGVSWRPWGRWHISIARREAVAALDAFIGPKC